VRRADELAVSLEAEPEPAGVWQTIMMTAKVDLECGGTPPFTYRWRFGDDSNKVVVRPDREESDTVHYFYQQLYRYLVRVEVEDSEGRRGSASMWVHVGLAVRLGSPMSMYVPLRGYIQEGPDAGLADPNWTPDQINYESYLVANARHKAHIVSVAAPGQKLPFEYEHHKRRQLHFVSYPRVDPLWGTLKILSLLQGVSARMGAVEVKEKQSGWRNGWGWQGIWWVPNDTYLWPSNARVRNSDIEAYWVDHLWRLSQDRYQMQVVTSHRRLTQVGVVQSVEQFTKGCFDYGAGGQLWYYLAYEPSLQYWFSVQENNLGSIVQALDGGTIHPELYQAFQRNGYTLSGNARVRVVNSGQEWDIFDGQNVFRLRLELEGEREDERQVLKVYRVLVQDWYAEPPLLDTICCRNRDGSPRPPITHAWYAKSGASQSFLYNGNEYFSYLLLSSPQPQVLPSPSGWVLRIGYYDSPAFVVPAWVGDPINNQIRRVQNNTPSLHFYSAIAVRTFFFPFSYVPVHPLVTWRISFNGEALSRDPLTYPQGTWRGTGAQLQGGNTMQQPKTFFGPYNVKIQSDWRR
jgi:hypothetical protein